MITGNVEPITRVEFKKLFLPLFVKSKDSQVDNPEFAATSFLYYKDHRWAGGKLTVKEWATEFHQGWTLKDHGVMLIADAMKDPEIKKGLTDLINMKPK